MPLRRVVRGAVTLASAAALAFAVGAAAQPRQLFVAGSGPDELWDVTTKMEMPGMPMAMPAQTHQMCLKKDRKPDDAIPRQDDNCRVIDSKVSGNTVRFKMACSGANPMTGEGEITSTPTTYQGRMQVKSTKKGEEMEMLQTFTGRKVGACTDQSQQVVAAQKAEGDAMLARTCAEGIDKLYAPMFFGQGAACAAQQKAFCDRVGAHARDMREP